MSHLYTNRGGHGFETIFHGGSVDIFGLQVMCTIDSEFRFGTHFAQFVLMAASGCHPPQESPSKGDTKCEEL